MLQLLSSVGGASPGRDESVRVVGAALRRAAHAAVSVAPHRHPRQAFHAMFRSWRRSFCSGRSHDARQRQGARTGDFLAFSRHSPHAAIHLRRALVHAQRDRNTSCKADHARAPRSRSEIGSRVLTGDIGLQTSSSDIRPTDAHSRDLTHRSIRTVRRWWAVAPAVDDPATTPQFEAEGGAFYYDDQGWAGSTCKRCAANSASSSERAADGRRHLRLVSRAPRPSRSRKRGKRRAWRDSPPTSAMPMGMHTVVGDSGWHALRRTRQRLLIARAMSTGRACAFDAKPRARSTITRKRRQQSRSSCKYAHRRAHRQHHS